MLGQSLDTNAKVMKSGKTPTEKLLKRLLGESKRRCDVNNNNNNNSNNNKILGMNWILVLQMGFSGRLLWIRR